MKQSQFMKRMVKLMKADKAKKDPFASGESFTTLHNKAARDEEHQQLLREQGFPSEQDPNAMRYQRYVEVESDPDSPDGVAHNTPPWIVNEASELLADIPDEDAPSYPKSEKAKNRAGELSKSEGIKYGSPITPERYQPIEKGLGDVARKVGRGAKRAWDKANEPGGYEVGLRGGRPFARRTRDEEEEVRTPPRGMFMDDEGAVHVVGTGKEKKDLPPFLRPREEESSRLTERDFESLESAKAAQTRNKKLLADRKLAQAQQKATKAETKVDKLPPFLEQSLTKRLVKLQKATFQAPTFNELRSRGPTGRSSGTPEAGSQASKGTKGMFGMTRSEANAMEANKQRNTSPTSTGFGPKAGPKGLNPKLWQAQGFNPSQAQGSGTPERGLGDAGMLGTPGLGAAAKTGKGAMPSRGLGTRGQMGDETASMQRNRGAKDITGRSSGTPERGSKPPGFSRTPESMGGSSKIDSEFNRTPESMGGSSSIDRGFGASNLLYSGGATPSKQDYRKTPGARNLLQRPGSQAERINLSKSSLVKRLVKLQKLQKQSPSEGGPQMWGYKQDPRYTTSADPAKRGTSWSGPAYTAGTEDEYNLSQGRPRLASSGEYASMQGLPGGTIDLGKNPSKESQQAMWNMSAQAERQRTGKGEFADAGPMDYKTQMGKEHPWGAVGTQTAGGSSVYMNPNTGTYSFKRNPEQEADVTEKYFQNAPKGYDSKHYPKDWDFDTNTLGEKGRQGLYDTWDRESREPRRFDVNTYGLGAVYPKGARDGRRADWY